MKRLRLLLPALALAAAWAAKAAEPLRICAAEDELPYSNRAGEGFENRLVEIIGRALGRPVENVWWTDPRHYVRDLLDRGLCDVVPGVDAGDPRLLTTRPYYRSGYAVIHRADQTLDLDDWTRPGWKKVGSIGFMPGTPAETMLRVVGRYNDNFNYLHELVGFKARRNQYVKYEPSRIVADVASGRAQVAVLWAPAAARYVRAAATPLVMRLLPDNARREDGQTVAQHYSTAMGVRKGDAALAEQLDAALIEKAAEIRALLQAEGIPLLPLDASQTNR